jgi:bidirectional [NiFe] hydrogenase diaphorase subunit
MSIVNFTIDGRPVSCEKDSMLLQVARDNGFEVPGLCYHAAEEPYGACRLCLVQITQGSSSWVETSCNYPVRRDGLRVETDTEAVRRYRRLNLELLMARVPESDAIRKMARELGVEHGRIAADGTDKCILCGLCVNVCSDLVRVGAIDFVGRGAARRVDTPYGESSKDCIGCGACAELCPTGHIVMVDNAEGTVRRLEPFHTEHELVPCPECGHGYVARRHLEHLREQLGEKAAVLAGCPVCRGRQRAEELRRVFEKLIKAV